jgi:hypothetical protein
MIYTIYPQLDTTIYEKSKTKNTGLDGILEIGHEAVMITQATSSCYNSRILMKFNLDNLETKINAGQISSASYYLSLRSAEATEIPFEYLVYAYPISASWYNGTGRFSNSPTQTDGASWQYRTSKVVGIEWDIPPAVDSYEWDEISDSWIDADILFGTNLSIYVTSSYCTNEGGATWWNFDGLECTQSFSYESSDIYMNVTPIISKWITGSGRLDNDGMVLMFSREMETSNQSISSLKFFATDSNTIYVPRLHVIWDDSSFVTGSLVQADFDNISVFPKLKKYYATTEKAKIYVNAFERYPQKAYTTQSYYTKNYYLPSSSYYEVRDAHTDEIILPFHTTGTKISCDAGGSYLNLWMDGFQPERFYRLVIKAETDGGDNVQIFDNNYYFKVTR